MLSDNQNKIKNAEINIPSPTNSNIDDQMRFRITFKIEGEIRRVFDQRSWERAYNLHDNLFRMKIDIDLKSDRKTLAHLNSIHKASLFWTRNPKLSYRIWIFIIKDNATFYPSDVEEARSLLFDVEKEVIANSSNFGPGTGNVYAQIRVWWGRHNYTPSCELKAKTNKISLPVRH